MRIPAFIAALLTASLTVACGSDTTTPTAPSTPTSPTTTTLSSRLTVRGAVSRSFTATQAGTVIVTLTSAGSSSTRVGLGLGVPATGVPVCALTTAITAVAGSTPQISAAVDAGQYCVAIFDVGTLTDAINFDITIVYP